MGPILGGSKNATYMVNLKDFPLIIALFGLVSYNYPCLSHTIWWTWTVRQVAHEFARSSSEVEQAGRGMWESYTPGSIHKILVQSEGKTHMDLFFLGLILTNVRFEWQDFERWRWQTWPAFFEDFQSDWEEPIQAPLKSLESQDFKICPESCNRI